MASFCCKDAFLISLCLLWFILGCNLFVAISVVFVVNIVSYLSCCVRIIALSL